jgi:uncharacterized protein (TIGR00369 family)
MPMSTDAAKVQLRPEITAQSLNDRGVDFLPGWFGLEILAVEPGLIRSRLAICRQMLAPNGFLHAASIIALADTTAGYATIAHLPAGAENFTTIELKSNFLGTVRSGAITALATPLHAGRNTQVWDVEVSGTENGQTSGRRIAAFRCTQMILWPKAA